MTAETTVVVDPKNRKVFITDDATKGLALIAAATNTGTYVGTDAAPDGAQEGKSLTWTATEKGTSVHAHTAVAAVVATAKPRKTVASLVSGALSAIYEETLDTPTTKNVLIVVDQTLGVVNFVEDTSGTKATATAAVTLDAGNSAQILLSEPEESSTEDLIFEGGSTGA
jgi:hypothetical protein